MSEVIHPIDGWLIIPGYHHTIKTSAIAAVGYYFGINWSNHAESANLVHAYYNWARHLVAFYRGTNLPTMRKRKWDEFEGVHKPRLRIWIEGEILNSVSYT